MYEPTPKEAFRNIDYNIARAKQFPILQKEFHEAHEATQKRLAQENKTDNKGEKND